MLNEKPNPILPGERATGEKHSTFSLFIYVFESIVFFDFLNKQFN